MLYMSSSHGISSRLSEWRRRHNDINRDITFQPTYSAVLDLLSKSNQLEEFLRKFAKDYVVGQWHRRPMRIDKTDLKELFSTSNTVISWRRTEQFNNISRRSTDLSDLLSNPSVIVTGLSYSCIMQAHSRIHAALNLFFYGTDRDTLADHVSLQLHHLASVWNKDFMMALHIPDTELMTPGSVESHLRPMLGDRQYESSFTNVPYVMYAAPLIIQSKL